MLAVNGCEIDNTPAVAAKGGSVAARRARPVYYGSFGGHLEQRAFDRQYVLQLTEGDPATGLHFTSYFGDLIRIKLRRRGWSSHDIEDICQETFLRVLQTLRRDGLQQPERLGAFVNSVSNNVMLEFCRSHRRTPTADEESSEPADGAISAEGALVSQERKDMVQSVLAELPEGDRRVLRMIFFDEAARDEVCAALNVDRDYLRVVLHRACAKFKVLAARTGAAAAF